MPLLNAGGKCVRFRALYVRNRAHFERFFACNTRYAMKTMRALASKRGVKGYFREPWLGSYFFCEPWIVSYFLREPWIDLPLFSLWFVNWVLFSSWTVNLDSFIFPVIRDWPLFFFREPWILFIIFVNVSPQIHMSRSTSLYIHLPLTIRNWFLMIDIGLLITRVSFTGSTWTHIAGQNIVWMI